MTTVFAVPCPGCGRQMWIGADGDAECTTCDRQYRARMGHLFPLAQQSVGGIQAVDRRGATGRS